MKKQTHHYTHVDQHGLRWRFVGSRPVSELADQVMAETGLEFPGEGRQLTVIEIKTTSRHRNN